MLHEVELLVAGLNGEILPFRCLVRPFRAKWRVGEDHIVTLTTFRFVDGIAQVNLRLQPMQEQVHQRQTSSDVEPNLGRNTSSS